MALRFHPKCLYTDPPPPIECDRYKEVVGDRAGFIARLSEKKIIGVQNVRLLFEIGTEAFTEKIFLYRD